MKKVYYVMIKGRTLESHDLKELLARAVSEKRNSDRKFRLQAASCRMTPVEYASGVYTCSAAMQ